MAKSRFSDNAGDCLKYWMTISIFSALFFVPNSLFGQSYNNKDEQKTRTTQRTHTVSSLQKSETEPVVDTGRSYIKPKSPEKKTLDSKTNDETKVHRLLREKRQLEQELKSIELRKRRLRHLAKLKLKRRCV